jgi:hypothetical protein
MVIVTTDMRVGEDIDALGYTVTVDGAAAPVMPYATVPLTGPHAVALPATLAVVSGPTTNGPVVIALDALHDGVPRVQRKARVVVPKSGVKALAMPLDWLCSTDADPTIACPAGQTCQAGSCVDAGVDADLLPDYVPPEAGACFDVPGCFTDTSFTPGHVDSSGRCTITNAISNGGQGVNVALVVDTAAHGNVGACIPGVGCLIPLVKGSPEGWRVLDADAGGPGILLPDAVCRDLGASVVTVAIAAPRLTCPLLETAAPLCSSQDMCVAAGVCPPGWRDWSGFTCSGTTTPQGLLFANTWTLADAGPIVAPNSFCATDGQAPSTDPLLIDDMSGGSQIKITPPAGEIAGTWWTSSDQGNPAIVPPSGALFTYTPVSPPVTPDGGPLIQSAACMSSPGFTGQTALFGFNWVLQPQDFAFTPTFDLSPYAGIRFWARASPSMRINVAFVDANTTTEVATAPCRDAGASGCGDPFAMQRFPIGETWAQYCVAWSQLKQGGWGAPFPAFDVHQVITAQFQVSGMPPQKTPPFDLCVSQIYFVAGDAGCGP